MRVAFVTGASSGFGHGVVSGLLDRGFNVYATMRNAEQRQAAFESLRAQHGERLRLLSLDVTDAVQREAAAARVLAEGRLDCLINNAGYAQFGALEDLAEAQLRRQLEVNFFGAALVTRELLPALRAARGVVLNVSSVFGFSAFPLSGAYCASKYALEGLSEALYHELRPHGVRVGLVEPGGHRTGFGAATEWGNECNPAYAEQTAGYRQLHGKLTSRAGTPPDAVVRTIVRLAQADRVPLRTVVGKDATLTALLHRLVPEYVRAPATSAMFARLLRRGGVTPS